MGAINPFNPVGGLPPPPAGNVDLPPGPSTNDTDFWEGFDPVTGTWYPLNPDTGDWMFSDADGNPAQEDPNGGGGAGGGVIDIGGVGGVGPGGIVGPASDSSNPWWRRTDYGTAARPSAPYFNINSDPNDIEGSARQDRMASYGLGHALDQSYRDAQNRYEGLEGGFLDWLLSGQGGYGDIFSGQGGYDDPQTKNLLQQDLLSQGMASPEELSGMDLQDWERSSITGDPWNWRNVMFGETNPDTGEFMPGSMSWLDTLQSEGSKRQREAYQGLDTGLQSAIDPAYLSLSDEFNQNYDWTPQNEQDLIDQAGRSVGSRRDAETSAMMRRAATSGNVDPLALAAARDRISQRSNIDSADAMTDARVRGRQLGLNVAQGREQMRLGTEQDISERLMRAAAQAGGARISGERDIAGQEQNLGRYSTDMLGEATRYGDAASSQRAADLASRRAAGLGNRLNTRYGQYAPASSLLSQRYGNIYGQRKQEEAEGRSQLGRLYNTGFEGAQLSRAGRAQAGLGSLSGAREATRTSYVAPIKPAWWEKVLAAGVAAAGAASGDKKKKDE